MEIQRIRKALWYRIIRLKNEIGKFFWRQPKIASIEETIQEIIIHRKSVSRFGDGELCCIFGVGNGFQEYDEQLAKRLKEILKSNKVNHIVCLPDCWGDISYMKDSSIEFHKGLLFIYREKWTKILDLDKQYYNTFITRFYNLFRDKVECNDRIKNLKQIWNQKDILLIEGEKTRSGVGNDLYSNAKSLKRILCPAENSFRFYKEIYSVVKKHIKSYEKNSNLVVLVALGMTATVLCYDLADIGVQIIDIGHLDIEYEWYLRNSEKIIIPGKYVNEVAHGREVAACCDENYLNSIIDSVGII